MSTQGQVEGQELEIGHIYMMAMMMINIITSGDAITAGDSETIVLAIEDISSLHVHAPRLK